MGKAQPLLEIADLCVDIPLANGTLHAVRNVGFSLAKGKALGIVGESGSGKSMTALALMGLLPTRAERRAKTFRLGNVDIIRLSEADIAANIAGKRMAMIFQEPMTSLNPVYTIGRQLTEVMVLHGTADQKDATERAVFLLDKVGIPAAASRLAQYPHQLSGGQRQRVMIAMALMNSPELIIADEPTTALDVTIQAQILRLLADLQHELGMAMILITHDLGVVSRTVDQVAVMYGGEFVETGSAAEILNHPCHPYTQGLLACLPEAIEPTQKRLGAIPGIVPSLIGEINGCAFANRCAHADDQCRSAPPPVAVVSGEHHYRCVLPPDHLPARAGQQTAMAGGGTAATSTHAQGAPLRQGPILAAERVSCVFDVRRGFFARKQALKAVDDVSLKLQCGEVLALVGESGCGKSTLARILLGLQSVNGGQVLFDDTPVAQTDRRDRARRIQPIFQDPYSSLNPRKTIGQTIRRPLDIHDVGDESARSRVVKEHMELVGLPHRLEHSYPNQVSGGQRQRVAIARAIIMRPEVVICDEPTSALDVSVQSQILNLLLDLRDELGLTYLIITHDLSVVEYMATRVAVMYLGQIVEVGEKAQIFAKPRHPYTQILLDSVLTLQPGTPVPDTKLGASFPNPLDMPSGCRFHPRCPRKIATCPLQAPKLNANGEGEVRCHLYA